MRGALIIGVAAVLLTGLRAEAQVVHGRDTTVYKGHTIIDFTDHIVDGDQVKPAGTYGYVPGQAKFKTMINLRVNFTPELQKSIDQL